MYTLTTYSEAGPCFVTCCIQCYPDIFVFDFTLHVIGCHIVANCVLPCFPPLPCLSLCMLDYCKIVERAQSKQSLWYAYMGICENDAHVYIVFSLLPPRNSRWMMNSAALSAAAAPSTARHPIKLPPHQVLPPAQMLSPK